MVRKLLAVAALVGLGAACCPIPVPRRATVRPDLTVTVVDAAGQPVANAAVRVRRFISGPPPETETHRWTATTDAAGAVHLDAIEQTETTLPLMMHGVVWYGWQVCAVGPGPAGGAVGSADHLHHAGSPIEPPVAVALRLDPSRPDCAWEAWTGP